MQGNSSKQIKYLVIFLVEFKDLRHGRDWDLQNFYGKLFVLHIFFKKRLPTPLARIWGRSTPATSFTEQTQPLNKRNKTEHLPFLSKLRLRFLNIYSKHSADALTSSLQIWFGSSWRKRKADQILAKKYFLLSIFLPAPGIHKNMRPIRGDRNGP